MGLRNKKILIVGGAGFVGSNLCRFILNHHCPREIWIVDNLLSSDIFNVPNDPRVIFVSGSITEDKILNSLPHDFEIIFHLACFHGNQSSIADPLADHENNTLTTLKLFNSIKNWRSLQKVVYAAAGCAVAAKTFNDALETTEDAPVSLFHDSPYSISKLIGEMYGNYYFEHFGLPFVKARFQNVYGPGEILGAGRWRGTKHTVWRNVIPTFIFKSIQGEALPLENNGNASRDFIYVDDMARGLIACAEKGEPGEVYNLASGVETSIGDLARLINSITGNIVPMNFQPPRDWDRSGKRFGSTEKAKNKLKFVAKVPLEKGIQETVSWTKNNQNFISDTISNHDIMMRQLDNNFNKS